MGRVGSVARERTMQSVCDKASEIVKAFNTWAYKREQPSDPGLLHVQVATCVTAGRPVEFVLYWGKGPRRNAAAPDLTCLDYLASFASRMRAVYRPGAELTLLLTDTHARLNNHCASDIDAYFADIVAAAEMRDMPARRLSEVVAAHPAGESAKPLSAYPVEMLERLERCAAKWYGGPGDAATGARQYLALNIIEKNAVAAAFPAAIFITFNSSEFREIFPDRLPIFYMYSVKKGIAVKPWFMAAAGEPIALRQPDTGWHRAGAAVTRAE